MLGSALNLRLESDSDGLVIFVTRVILECIRRAYDMDMSCIYMARCLQQAFISHRKLQVGTES